MPVRSGVSHWGAFAKFFHWTTVVLILVQATIGLVMVNLPKKPSIIPVYSFHKSLGLTIFAFALLRLLWRAFDPRPEEPGESAQRLESRAAFRRGVAGDAGSSSSTARRISSSRRPIRMERRRRWISPS